MSGWLIAAVGLVALLYSSVGHAGATGYIAVMTLFGLPPDVIRPTALMLNVVVATIATVQFARAGHFRRGLFLPLAAASVPAATAGGMLKLAPDTFESVLGVVLLLSAVRIIVETARGGLHDDDRTEPPAWLGDAPLRLPLLAGVGGGIGFLSGLTGVGGGVFLTPVLLALRAAPVKTIAAVTAAFILVNSLAGLAGRLLGSGTIPAVAASLVAVVAVGGLVGGSLGARRLPVPILKLLMAVVLLIACAKLLT
jgi:uncharacterized membrane protein YfcA